MKTESYSDEILRKQRNSIYMPLELAVDELRTRRESSALHTGSALERMLSTKLYGVVFRQVATPNYELQRFLSLTTSVGLTPLILEFHADRFLTRNLHKCALARLRFSDGPSCTNGTRFSTITVADMAISDGMALRDVVTLWKQPLIEFHHELMFSQEEFQPVELFDGSEWFSSHGHKARNYYTAFLSLFVEHAILFDDFLLTDSEEQFTSEVVIPAFEESCSIHGRQPLICRIDPTDNAQNPAWFHYAQGFVRGVRHRLSATGRHTACDAVEVRRCDLGFGVFALQHFSSGQQILRLSGSALTFEEAHADFNMLQVAPRLYLDLDPPAVFINHSCDPNAGIADDLLLVALRDISAGEEIRYDYSTTMRDNTATMDCACGSPRCRKRVGDFDSLPVDQQQQYLRLGIVLSFIHAAFTEEKEGEQDGTGQPATRPESKSEGSDIPLPESEGRSR